MSTTANHPPSKRFSELVKLLGRRRAHWPHYHEKHNRRKMNRSSTPPVFSSPWPLSATCYRKRRKTTAMAGESTTTAVTTTTTIATTQAHIRTENFTIVVRQMLCCIGRFHATLWPTTVVPTPGGVAHAALSRARRIRFIGARAAGGRPRRVSHGGRPDRDRRQGDGRQHGERSTRQTGGGPPIR